MTRLGKGRIRAAVWALFRLSLMSPGCGGHGPANLPADGPARWLCRAGLARPSRCSEK